jgi:hypothetical protein
MTARELVDTIKNALAWCAIMGGCLLLIWAARYVVGFPPPWFNNHCEKFVAHCLLPRQLW